MALSNDEITRLSEKLLRSMVPDQRREAGVNATPSEAGIPVFVRKGHAPPTDRSIIEPDGTIIHPTIK